MFCILVGLVLTLNIYSQWPAIPFKSFHGHLVLLVSSGIQRERNVGGRMTLCSSGHSFQNVNSIVHVNPVRSADKSGTINSEINPCTQLANPRLQSCKSICLKSPHACCQSVDAAHCPAHSTLICYRCRQCRPQGRSFGQQPTYVSCHYPRQGW
jgi:hypothetical protein